MTGRLSICTAALALIALATALPAQHHAADWSIIGHGLMPAAIAKIDRVGTMTTVMQSGQLPLGTYFLCGTLDIDDRTYLMPIISRTMNGSFVQVDQAGTILRTVQVLAGAQQGYLYDVILDSNGDYIVTEGWGLAQGRSLLRVSRTLGVTTIHTGAPLINPRAVVTDIDTGDFLVVGFNTGTVFRVSPNGSTITSVSSSFLLGRSQATQHVGSGDLFTGDADPQGGFLLRMNRAGAVTTLRVPGVREIGGIHADRSSAASPRIALGSTPGLFFYDLANGVVTTLLTYNAPSEGYNHVFPSREVATVKRGPGRWDMLLHFQGQAGNAFAIGLGLSGVRPGLPLPDGRRVLLNADDLTRLSVFGQLGPILQGNVGTLNASARATAQLDVSTLPGLSGLRVWALAVTLDANAPLGIRSIADPVVLVL